MRMHRDEEEVRVAGKHEVPEGWVRFRPGALGDAFAAYAAEANGPGRAPSHRGILVAAGLSGHDVGRFGRYDSGELKMHVREAAALAALLGTRLTRLADGVDEARAVAEAEAATGLERCRVVISLRAHRVRLSPVASWEAVLAARATGASLVVAAPDEAAVTASQGAAIRAFWAKLEAQREVMAARGGSGINLDLSRRLAEIADGPLALVGLSVLEGRLITRAPHEEDQGFPWSWPRRVLVLRIVTDGERDALLRDGMRLDRGSEPLLPTYAEEDSEMHADTWARLAEWVGNPSMATLEPSLDALVAAETRLEGARAALERLDREWDRQGQRKLKEVEAARSPRTGSRGLGR